MKNGYTKFDDTILQTWIDNGVGYLTVIPLHQTEKNEYGGEHAYQVMPSIQNTPDDPEVYSISSDEVALYAANKVKKSVYMVHESDL